jgi:chromosome condensin MukBEF ATPase and DNA-binding subunit MukB
VETFALVLGALLTVACVVFVARPLLRQDRDAEALVEPNAAEQLRVRALERRDRALAALKELEFDHRTGKVSDEDYRALVGPLRQEAAAALRELEHEDRPQREVKADVHG